MYALHDPMLEDSTQEVEPVVGAGGSSNGGNQRQNLLDLVQDVQTMAKAMHTRLMVNGRLKDGIAIREGKEAVSSISSLLSLILRNKDSLEDMHFQMAFDNAVVEVLEEMDAEHRTQYAERLQNKLNLIEA